MMLLLYHFWGNLKVEKESFPLHCQERLDITPTSFIYQKENNSGLDIEHM